jgi:hypothetical protein
MIVFKDDYAQKGWEKLHPILKNIGECMGRWSMQYDGKPLTITDTISSASRDKKLGRISLSHQEGRAIDIRTIDMSRQKLTDFLTYFSDKFNHYGYLNSAKVQKLMLYKPNPPHIHCCIGYNIVEQYKNKYPKWVYANKRG